MIARSALQLDVRGGNVQPLSASPGLNDSVITGLVGEITPTLINTFRFGFVRNRIIASAQSPAATASALALPGTNTAAGFAALDVGAVQEPIDVGAQQAREQIINGRNFQFVEDLTWVKGGHTFQFGANLRRLPTLISKTDRVSNLASLTAVAGAGAFTNIPASARPPTCGGGVTTNCLAAADLAQWNSLYASALGLVDNLSIVLARDGGLNALPLGTPIVADTVHNAYEFYAQDIWRIRPSLTLNLGLNYQWATPPREKDGKQTLLIDNTTRQPIDVELYLEAKCLAASTGQIFNPQIAYLPINSSGRDGIFDTDRNNFGPRISAAWNPTVQNGLLGRLFGERKTVLRGGFGIVYDRVNTVTSVLFPQLGVGFTQTLAVNAPTCTQTGAGGAACNAASTNITLSRFRVGVDGALPLPTVPVVSNPVVPPANFNELQSFQVDPHFKIGMNYTGDFTIQRELPGNMIFEIGWVGRWARNLQQSRDVNAVPIFFRDPASGQTSADATGTRVRGMLNNCGGGKTPWNTIVTCEENFDQYFSNLGKLPDSDRRKAMHTRYGLPTAASERRWENYYDRFDVSKEPNEPFRFGYAVEIDPFNPNTPPKKRTALGRLKHEAATFVVAPDQRVVAYTGDDQRFDYMYKFVTKGKFNPQAGAANGDLLDEGTLYVAKFNDDGTGQWLPLVAGQGPLASWTQAEICIYTRGAADLLGATMMDRPEDIETNPVNGKVYAVMTNNTQRGTAGRPGADKPNPRNNNRHGHIIEITEDKNDPTATTFKWEIFCLCGDPSVAADGTYWAGWTGPVSPISSPDNITFDSKGNLWIATDGQINTFRKNDGVYVVPVEGAQRGWMRQLLSGVPGGEVASLALSPDDLFLFASIQHPAEGSTLAQPTSRFPYGVPRPSVVAVENAGGTRAIGS